MEEKLVSIIVPVYNIEKYISQCIESLINQTYRNIEILLIDDGSIDLSSKICDNYAQKDNRIKTIHKKNTGVSSTRNLGIELSTGYFIMFVDSDDYVKEDFVESMVKSIEYYDICICGYTELFMKKSNILTFREENLIIDRKKAIDFVFTDKSFGGYLWNKIFLSSIIKQKGLKFNDEIHMCEDVLFVIEYLINCNKFKCISKNLYFYRMRKNSMVWNIKSEKYESLLLAYYKILTILNNNNIDDFNCRIELLIITFKSKIDLKKIDNDVIDFNEEFKNTIKDKNISKKIKLKLVIYRYFNLLYQIYMCIKKVKCKQYS